MPSETSRFEERWRVVPRSETRRTVGRMVITFVIAFIVVSVAMVTLALLTGAGDVWLFPAIFASMAAGVVALIKSFDLGSRLESATARDRELRRRVRRVVLRRTSEPLTGEDLARAARWASIFSAFQPLSLAGILLNLAGIALLQVNSLTYPNGAQSMPWLAPVTAIILIGGAVVLVPLAVRQIRRARAFAQQHQHLLVDDTVTS